MLRALARRSVKLIAAFWDEQWKKFDYPGDLKWQFFSSDKFNAFTLFVILCGSKTEEDAEEEEEEVEGLPDENPEGGFKLSLGTV